MLSAIWDQVSSSSWPRSEAACMGDAGPSGLPHWCRPSYLLGRGLHLEASHLEDEFKLINQLSTNPNVTVSIQHVPHDLSIYSIISLKQKSSKMVTTRPCID